MTDLDRVKAEYKKLKASLYFDKTQLPLRDRLVLFEQDDIDDKLGELKQALIDGKDWEQYEQQILDQIGILLYPKKLKPIPEDTAIFNADNIAIEMSAPQFFIDLPVEGHILGVLWILSIGRELDKNSDDKNPNGMYEHSYGNRLKETLFNEEIGDVTYSPGLFEPYFSQFESWRDHGLDKAKERLDDKQDAIILTLDFKSFYYSVDLRDSDFENILKRLPKPADWNKRVNHFVYKVIQTYSDKLREHCFAGQELDIKQRNVLPIGFLPSNILSNWVLTKFDDAIIKEWNPVYYGRYVDDVIIVDKVEKNDPLYKMAHERSPSDRLKADDVINLKLVKTNIFVSKYGSVNRLFEERCDGCEHLPKLNTVYQIATDIMGFAQSEITVQSQKVKLFYFQSGATRALLDCFKTKIAQNASEFRLLPNMDSVLEQRNYSEIFDLRNEEGINKFRGITGVELDKFALAKFLGKYRKVSGMIESAEESVFEQDLLLIMDERTLISNYGAWERLLEILIINKRYELYQKLSVRILDAIMKLQVPKKMCGSSFETHDALLRVFLSALHRTAAISWGTDIVHVIDKISQKAGALRGDQRFAGTSFANLDAVSITRTRLAYCRNRMINKYIMPLPVDSVLVHLTDSISMNLSSLDDMLKYADVSWLEERNKSYIYYPYMVTPQELSYTLVCNDLKATKKCLDPHAHQTKLEEYFIRKNYPNAGIHRSVYELRQVKSGPITDTEIKSSRALFYTKVSCGEKIAKDKLTVAVGSAKLSMDDFNAVLDQCPNRGYERYKQLADIIDEAVRRHADILVLPECFLPFEWIPVVTRLCANNDLALVTGIEHFIVEDLNSKSNGVVYNLTATILPYSSDEYKFAHVSYHNKVAYSPMERSAITERRYSFVEGNTYQLFGWHDVWFPVYCCFELASIHDRAIFQEYADMLVAVEWNRDIPYYSNILESLSRDLHCYCIQANSSDYGDIRIVAPKENVSKDIIKTKGGLYPCALMDVIDIKGLRDFQMLGYHQQKADKRFKPTPPGVNPDNIINKKRKHTLFI